MKWIKFIGVMIIISCNNQKNKIMSPSDGIPESFNDPNQKLSKKANLFYHENQYIQAILCYDTLISCSPTNGEYYFKRGYCHSMVFDEPEAVADYKKAISYKYSEKVAVLLNLGIVYKAGLQNYDSAIYYFDECLKIDPTNAKAIRQRSETVILKERKKGIFL